jgi:DNA-binding MarR family transcriptional regulator
MPRRAEIGHLFRQVSREVHERLRHAFRGIDLPPMALFFIKHIDERPGVTVSDLARHCGTVKSHCSKTVDVLVRKGYVEKRADPDDQRLLRVYVTGSGTELMAGLETRALGVWSDVLAGVPEEELADVERGLRTLLGALAKSRTAAPPAD